MQCTNNLKQIGLGIHVHVDAHKVLPTNSTMQNRGAYYYQLAANPSYNYGRLNYIVAILPNMEQAALYEAAMVDLYTCAGNGTPAAEVATSPWFKQVPGLRCPSDGGNGGSGSATAAGVGRNNYMASSGDWPEGHVYAVRTNPGAYIDNPRGAFPMKKTSTDSGVSFTEAAPKSLGAIIDGTSNTVAVAEKCVGETGSSRNNLNIKRAVVNNSSAVAGPANTVTENPRDVGVPSLCFGSAVASGKFLIVEGYGDIGGIRWADGVAPYASFATILPPNAPSCTADPAEPLGRVLSSASSEHTGGVNCLRFDGSVNFVSDTVSTSGGGVDKNGVTGLDAFAVSSGASPYGVWGAFGSINGGESVSL